MRPLLAILIIVLLLVTVVVVDMTLDNWGRTVTPGRRERRSRRPDTDVGPRAGSPDAFTTDPTTRQPTARPATRRPPRPPTAPPRTPSSPPGGAGPRPQ
jgi:hypothetical protein